MSDAYLSSTGRETMAHMNNNKLVRGPISAPNTPESLRRGMRDKKDKMEYNQMMMRSLTEQGSTRPLSYHGRSGSLCIMDGHQYPPPHPPIVNKRHIVSSGARSKNKESLLLNRRSMPIPYQSGENNRLLLGREKIQDVLELDTKLPRIDLEKIETHLRQAREEERKYRSDRDEIRRRLALEGDWGCGGCGDDKPLRKHNLQSRLQTSMNLQVCFMNETTSDNESPNSDDSEARSQQQQQPQNQSLPSLNKKPGISSGGEQNFIEKHDKLQAEVRHALAQAKDVARLQLTQEREGRAHSPITEMVRNTLEKIGVGLPPDRRRRMSRQLLTEINVTQLQVIVNDLHSHIEKLNESLVSMLLERDDLHMEQDSMLVDIEDLTRYL